jgi:hypothetical protein
MPNRYYIEILLFIMIKFFFPSRLDFQAFYHCHPPLSTEKCGHERPLIPVGKAAIARVALYPALWPQRVRTYEPPGNSPRQPPATRCELGQLALPQPQGVNRSVRIQKIPRGQVCRSCCG